MLWNFKSSSASCAVVVLAVSLTSTAMAAPDQVETLIPAQASDFYDAARPSVAKVALGRALFFDKVLSGNRNISCATCHHPERASSDGISLPLGEGAVGLGPKRHAGTSVPVFGRVPRNSQALFNLGATEFAFMFHDGRVSEDPYNNWGNRFWTPAREKLPPGLDSVLAAQAMFPVLSRVEMLGHKGENEIADAVASDRLGEAWNLLTNRLRAIPAYVDMFRAAYPELKGPDDLNFVRVANAIAAFEATAFRATGSPFDQFLESRDPSVMGEPAIRGMALFYGEAECGSCHSGRFQTDQGFHAIAMPQIGPGKAARFETHHRDTGRMRVTGAAVDAYRFRTPSLRNIAMTGPYGHDGAYRDLESVVRHHLDPVARLYDYDSSQAVLPEFAGKPDFAVLALPNELAAIAVANELTPIMLSDVEVSQLIAFLNSLSDESVIKGRLGIPVSVPSGLPVER